MVHDDAAAKRQRRRIAGGMGGMSDVPEDLQHEVFSRVGDVKALFRFATTCRGWLRRFTDRDFLHELCPGGNQGSGSGHHHHRARLLGVFVQDKKFKRWNMAMVQARMTTMAAQPQQRASSDLAPVFFPALGSPFGPAGRAITSFAGGGDDDGTFDYAEPLAARRGIVLLRLAPRTPEDMVGCHLFGVCNPVTGDCHVLPPLEWSRGGDRAKSYAIITAADSHSDDGDHPPAAAAPDYERWCDFNHESLLALIVGSVFILDLDAKVMEKVFTVDFNSKGKRYRTCVPYEMDLVEFFTLQLGAIPERLGSSTTISGTESP